MRTHQKAAFSLLAAASIISAATGCANQQPRSAVIPYPLKDCLVSQNELGSMGDVVTEVYQGREIKFCCKPCVKKFHANPEKYLGRIM